MARRRLHEDDPYARDTDWLYPGRTGQFRRSGSEETGEGWRPSLYGFQSLCTDDIAEQIELLWSGKQYDAGRSIRFRHEPDHCRRQCDQAGVRMALDQEAEPCSVGRSEWTIRRHQRRAWAVDTID